MENSRSVVVIFYVTGKVTDGDRVAGEGLDVSGVSERVGVDWVCVCTLAGLVCMYVECSVLPVGSLSGFYRPCVGPTRLQTPSADPFDQVFPVETWVPPAEFDSTFIPPDLFYLGAHQAT